MKVSHCVEYLMTAADLGCPDADSMWKNSAAPEGDRTQQAGATSNEASILKGRNL